MSQPPSPLGAGGGRRGVDGGGRFDWLTPGWVMLLCTLMLLAGEATVVVRAIDVLVTKGSFGGSPSYGQIAAHVLDSGMFSLDGVNFTAYRPPLYPLLLVEIMRLAGSAWREAAIAVQAVLLVIASLLTMDIVRRLTGSRLAVVLTAGLLFLDIPLQNESLYEVEMVLYVLFAVLAVWLLIAYPGRTWSLIALAIVTGLAHMTRPVGLMFVLFWPWALWSLPRRTGWGAIVGFALVMAAVLAAVVLPWQIAIQRNLGITTLASSTSGGLNLFKGNNPDTPILVPRIWYDEYQPWADRALASAGISPREEIRADRFLRDSTTRFIRRDPGRFAHGLAVKLLALHSPLPTPWGRATLVDRNGGLVLENYRPLISAAVAFKTAHWLVVLAGVAICLGWTVRHAAAAQLNAIAIMSWFVLAHTVVHVVTQASTRYRLPVDPLMIVMAVIGVLTIVQRPRSANSAP